MAVCADMCVQAPNVDNDAEECDEELEDSPLVQMMKDQYGNYVVCAACCAAALC